MTAKLKPVAVHFPMHITPDPTQAISDFLWSLAKARSLGYTPSNAYTMAEHFLRGDVSTVFYSSSGGIVALAADEEALDSDDAFETVQFIMERVAARRKTKRAATIETPAEPVEEERSLEIMPSQRGGLARVKQAEEDRASQA